jgi:hypothetical protein
MRSKTANFKAPKLPGAWLSTGARLPPPPRFDGRNLHAGFAVGGVAGYCFDAQQGVFFDLEAEAAFRQNSVDGFEVVGVGVGASVPHQGTLERQAFVRLLPRLGSP